MDFIKKHNNQLLFLFCGLILVTIPLKESYNSIAIILFLGFNIYNLIILKVKFKISKKVIFFILPVIFILFQSFYSELIVYEKNLLRSLPIVLFPVFVSLLRNQYINIVERILKLFVISCVAYSSFLILTALYRQFNFSPDFSKINWYFFAYHDFTAVIQIHPTYLGLINCLAFSLSLKEIISNKKIDLLNLMTILILAIVILLSGSRISLVCLGIVIFYIVMVNYKLIEKKVKIFLLIFFLIIPIIVFTAIPIAKERMIDMTFGLKQTFSYAKYGNNIKYTGSIGPRLEIWKCALETTKTNYFLGNGFGYTQMLLNECYKSKGYDSYAQLNYQTHSQYLNNYARGGILGLFILLIVLLIPLFYSIKNKNVLYTSFLIIIIVSCLTENILNRHIGIVFYAFFNSLFFFTSNKL